MSNYYSPSPRGSGNSNTMMASTTLTEDELMSMLMAPAPNRTTTQDDSQEQHDSQQQQQQQQQQPPATAAPAADAMDTTDTAALAPLDPCLPLPYDSSDINSSASSNLLYAASLIPSSFASGNMEDGGSGIMMNGGSSSFGGGGGGGGDRNGMSLAAAAAGSLGGSGSLNKDPPSDFRSMDPPSDFSGRNGLLFSSATDNNTASFASLGDASAAMAAAAAAAGLTDSYGEFKMDPPSDFSGSHYSRSSHRSTTTTTTTAGMDIATPLPSIPPQLVRQDPLPPPPSPGAAASHVAGGGGGAPEVVLGSEIRILYPYDRHFVCGCGNYDPLGNNKEFSNLARNHFRTRLLQDESYRTTLLQTHIYKVREEVEAIVQAAQQFAAAASQVGGAQQWGMMTPMFRFWSATTVKTSAAATGGGGSDTASVCSATTSGTKSKTIFKQNEWMHQHFQEVTNHLNILKARLESPLKTILKKLLKELETTGTIAETPIIVVASVSNQQRQEQPLPPHAYNVNTADRKRSRASASTARITSDQQQYQQSQDIFERQQQILLQQQQERQVQEAHRSQPQIQRQFPQHQLPPPAQQYHHHSYPPEQVEPQSGPQQPLPQASSHPPIRNSPGPPSPHLSSNPYSNTGYGGGRELYPSLQQEQACHQHRRPVKSNLDPIAKALSSSPLLQQHRIMFREALVMGLLDGINNTWHSSTNTVYLASLLEPSALVSSVASARNDGFSQQHNSKDVSCLSALLSSSIALQVAQLWVVDNHYSTSKNRCAYWLDASDQASMIDSYRQVMRLLRQHNSQDDPNEMDTSSNSNRDDDLENHRDKRRKVAVAQVAAEMYAALRELYLSDSSFQCVLIYANAPDPGVFRDWFAQDATPGSEAVFANNHCGGSNAPGRSASCGLVGIFLSTTHPSYGKGRHLGQLFPSIMGIVQDAKKIDTVSIGGSGLDSSSSSTAPCTTSTTPDTTITAAANETSESSSIASGLPSFWWKRLPQSNLPPLFDYDDDSDSDADDDEFHKKLTKRMRKDGRILSLTKTGSGKPSTNILANRFTRDWQRQESTNRFGLWLRSSSEPDLRESYLAAIRRVTHTDESVNNNNLQYRGRRSNTQSSLSSLSGYSSWTVGSPPDVSPQACAQELMDLLMHMREESPTFEWTMVFSNVPEEAKFEEWFFSAASNWWNSRGRFLLTSSSSSASLSSSGTATAPVATTPRPFHVQILNEDGNVGTAEVRSLSVDK